MLFKKKIANEYVRHQMMEALAGLDALADIFIKDMENGTNIGSELLKSTMCSSDDFKKLSSVFNQFGTSLAQSENKK